NSESYLKLADSNSYQIFQSVFSGLHGPLQSAEDFINASLYFELKTFLHGLLVVEDKLSMAHSLETRVPFLDNDLVDFALQIHVAMKLNNMEKQTRLDENLPFKQLLKERAGENGKIILRKTMSKLLPEEIITRKKQGFSAPDASWFRGQSIDYINRLLR